MSWVFLTSCSKRNVLFCFFIVCWPPAAVFVQSCCSTAQPLPSSETHQRSSEQAAPSQSSCKDRFGLFCSPCGELGHSDLGHALTKLCELCKTNCFTVKWYQEFLCHTTLLHQTLSPYACLMCLGVELGV